MAVTMIEKAKGLLAVPTPRANLYGTLAAAALAATAAVLMAGVMVLGPGVRFDEAVVEGSAPGPV